MLTLLDRILHPWPSRTAPRSLPRLDTLRLSAHDLADLNLPLAVRGRLERDRGVYDRLPGSL